ncbi:DUF2750 domain-containing protein [Pseudoalteromonas tunicata]|jgi:hypothetical protein|uniref:DUF2750 domain-containing protein n=1 Tax=Pseudoalteromonas tunicata D2 TaxID=87626 RepID=A4C3U3_9GAMM|nr:DUF2750 domain-containing protein [Pseudoalteromonas tunicata]ATC96496.1 hypothetical protein PTUN_b0021 [Pseudoalteromonas tunicata]AXT33369.1 DUF2750 domain-containing protein [Pseudoalteromonas tunicata]EAR30225.1 hypothetical protein PTD2_01611 [Pseudoalteromonas tunicata D2]MDP4985619.1 DUF2750 domain-containing protein [Pseudoalteromonas tunicata]MDP5214468.1 DUF2750 domain-containing protein [Pseudoalteromonas tunicata]
MSTALDAQKISAILKNDNQQRYQYLLKEVVANNEIWILTDEHGCVMLNTDDEDCVPVWPNQEFAELWATGDWQDCQAQAITLQKWQTDWTNGLADDELALAVFPVPDKDGLIVYPDEFDFELNAQAKKK